MTTEIVLTTQHATRINPQLLRDELNAVLATPVALRARHERGILVEAHICKLDGTPFSTDEQNIIHNVASAHNPDQLTKAQAAERDAQSRREAALEMLTLVDTDTLLARIANASTLEELRPTALDVASLVRALITLKEG